VNGRRGFNWAALAAWTVILAAGAAFWYGIVILVLRAAR
jgi:hypothetical protein